ncbi:ArsC/Spx/MgsR family protein [Dechloromonas sp. H13]|uniref:ArsC/Spx/MgsR family protein n=1 Tax=Dechloromonas sp. H13 TaxID=2570193 RepID=UPI0012918C58|nr:ArsC/Spx/MgsR family protein [Dechloromonas sp. H13]
MAVVTFYEKPGCKGNLRQKTLLAAAGHTVQAKSLKTEAWTADRLLAFLGRLPIGQWFNPSAPAVKSGEIVPENIGFEHALQLLLANPLLIRRPLMEVGDERRVGFDIAAVDAWIGLKNVELPEGDIEACVHGPAGHGSCGSHAHDDEAEESSHGCCGTH